MTTKSYINYESIKYNGIFDDDSSDESLDFTFKNVWNNQNFDDSDNELDNESDNDSDNESDSESDNESDSESDSESDKYESYRDIYFKNIYNDQNSDNESNCESNSESDDDYVIPKSKIECQHYKTFYYKVVSSCCNDVFSCFQCHDEFHKNEHIIDRNNIKIICLHCGKFQQASPSCIFCHTVFFTYHCSKCLVFHDKLSNYSKFHCDQCNQCYANCRQNNTDKFVHCSKCNFCYRENIKKHICYDDPDICLCSICLENLKNGDILHILLCGHILHHNCFLKLIKINSKCPECLCNIKT